MRLLLIVISLCFISPGFAAMADKDAATQIDADSMSVDELAGKSIFKGHVVITRGSMQVRGTKVEMTQDKLGYQSLLVEGSTKELAYFRQGRDKPGEFIEGQAERIEYNGRSDEIKFTHQAYAKRMENKTLLDEIKGAQITYNNLTDSFRVEGAVAGSKPGRVRITLAPGSRGLK